MTTLLRQSLNKPLDGRLAVSYGPPVVDEVGQEPLHFLVSDNAFVARNGCWLFMEFIIRHFVYLPLPNYIPRAFRS
jgi:hypothetical protein